MKKFEENLWVKFELDGVTTIGITKLKGDEEIVVIVRFDGLNGIIPWHTIYEQEITKLHFLKSKEDENTEKYEKEIFDVFQNMKMFKVKQGEA